MMKREGLSFFLSFFFCLQKRDRPPPPPKMAASQGRLTNSNLFSNAEITAGMTTGLVQRFWWAGLAVMGLQGLIFAVYIHNSLMCKTFEER